MTQYIANNNTNNIANNYSNNIIKIWIATIPLEKDYMLKIYKIFVTGNLYIGINVKKTN